MLVQQESYGFIPDCDKLYFIYNLIQISYYMYYYITFECITCTYLDIIHLSNECNIAR